MKRLIKYSQILPENQEDVRCVFLTQTIPDTPVEIELRSNSNAATEIASKV